MVSPYRWILRNLPLTVPTSNSFVAPVRNLSEQKIQRKQHCKLRHFSRSLLRPWLPALSRLLASTCSMRRLDVNKCILRARLKQKAVFLSNYHSCVVCWCCFFFHLFAETPKLYTFVWLLNPENTYRSSFHPSLSYPPNWWAGSKADRQGVGPCDLCIFIILGHHWDGAQQQSGDLAFNLRLLLCFFLKTGRLVEVGVFLGVVFFLGGWRGHFESPGIWCLD